MHGATSVARTPRAPGEDTSNAPKSCAALQNPSHRSRIKHRYEPNKPMHHEISPPDALRSVHPPSPRAHTHKSVRRQRLLSPQSAASCSLAHGSAWTAPTGHGQRTAVVPTDRPRSATPAVPCRPNPSTHPRAARSYQSGLSTARSTRVCCIAASAKHQSRSSSTVRTSTPTNHCTIQPATPRSLST